MPDWLQPTSTSCSSELVLSADLPVEASVWPSFFPESEDVMSEVLLPSAPPPIPGLPLEVVHRLGPLDKKLPKLMEPWELMMGVASCCWLV